TGGFDGRQAHTRRHIDRLKKKVAQLEARRDQFSVSDPRREPSERKLAVLRREIACCWRNNAQIRGALWRTLRYKCHLSGLRLLWQHPKGTTHTCPKCGLPAHDYASPALDAKELDAGPWLRCKCGWNGARDYAAAINIALLGVASVVQEREHQEQQRPRKRPT